MAPTFVSNYRSEYENQEPDDSSFEIFRNTLRQIARECPFKFKQKISIMDVTRLEDIYAFGAISFHD